MKWFGQVGFEVESEEVVPGIYNPPEIEEKDYYGDVLRKKISHDNSQIVTDFNISNQISILSDEFINKNLHKIVFVTFMGAKWKVNSVDVEYPRIILDIGGVYKEEEETDGD